MDAAIARVGRADSRHLLRHAAPGARDRRRARQARSRRVRPGNAAIVDDRETPLFDGVPEESRVWMSHGDSVVDASATAIARWHRRRAATSPRWATPRRRSTAFSFIPRSCTRSTAGRFSTTFCTRSPAWAAIGRWSPSSSARSRRFAQRVGSDKVDLRALRRRGFGGCGDARRARDRRAAHLHLRRSRPAAPRRGRSRSWPRFARCCISTSSRSTRASAFLHKARRHRGSGAQANHHRSRVHRRLRSGGGEDSRRQVSWCRARSIPT